MRVFFYSSGGTAAYREGTAAEKAAAEPQRTEKNKSSGGTAAYGERVFTKYIRTMKELLKLWKADCEAEGFSSEDYIVAFKVVVLFSIFLAIL